VLERRGERFASVLGWIRDVAGSLIVDEEFSVIDGRFESGLASGVDAPGVARRLLTEWFAPALADGTLMTARLLVSELVSNAVRHGRGRITLRAQLFKRYLLVEVTDEGVGFECEVRERDFEPPRVGGWGLSLVDAAATHWGVCPDSSHVWFELERPGPWLESPCS
jgi:anti-sigma regulatory factor (Ser/Thr protein kinase)